MARCLAIWNSSASAGAAVLDQAAADMIEGAAPFPPPPRESFPGPTAVLEATIAVYPRISAVVADAIAESI